MTQRNPTPAPAGHILPVSFEGEAPPRFAEDASQFFTRVVNLATARDQEPFAATGTILWAITASDVAALVTVHFNDRRGQGIPYQQGMMLRGMRFDRLFFTNSVQAGETLTFFYGVEKFGNINVENAAQAGTTSTLASATTNLLTKPTVFTSTADLSIAGLTAAVLLAANAARREAIFSNLAANASPFRVGDAAVGAAEGIELGPGQTLILNTTAEVRGFNTAAGAQSITIAETRD